MIFISLDISGGSAALSAAVKFSVIILCFCYALFSESHSKSISSVIKLAMLFTLISDLLILILDYYLYGVLTFIPVQLLYNFRISLQNVNRPDDGIRLNTGRNSGNAFGRFAFWLAIQLTISAAICLLLAGFGIGMEPLLIASAIYFSGLFINTIRAVILAVKNNRDYGIIMFACGLLLFLLCDINVGLFNLTSFINLTQDKYSFIYNMSSVLMWVFYAPSQVLIALSKEKS